MKKQFIVIGMVVVLLLFMVIILTQCTKKVGNELETETEEAQIVFTPYEGYAYETLFADTKYPVTPFQRPDGRLEFDVEDGREGTWELELSEGLEVDYEIEPAMPHSGTSFVLMPEEGTDKVSFHVVMVDRIHGTQNEWDLTIDEESGMLLIENPESKEIPVDLSGVEGYEEHKDLVEAVGVTTGKLRSIGEQEIGSDEASGVLYSLNYDFAEGTRTLQVSDQITFEQLKSEVNSMLTEGVEYTEEEREVKGQKVLVYRCFGTTYGIWERGTLECYYHHYGDDNRDTLMEEIEAFIN